MIAQLQQPSRMAPDEYLIWEAQQELRYEYVDGEIIAMTGGTVPHNDIALNLYRLLYPHLRKRGCRINVSDVKVQSQQGDRYFYPDVVVTCHPDDRQAQAFIKHPTVIVEVLSPSTETYDRTKKLQYYRQMPSLQEYVLVNANTMSIEVYQRGEGRMWLYCDYGAEDVLQLKSLAFECPVAAVYEDIFLTD
ncbi:MAG: Uma2 family endonuclease [Spirulinaceae cyanobacterium]